MIWVPELVASMFWLKTDMLSHICDYIVSSLACLVVSRCLCVGLSNGHHVEQ